MTQQKNDDDSWKDEYGTFTAQGKYKNLRQLESEGWEFDFDGGELKTALKNMSFNPNNLKISIEGKSMNQSKFHFFYGGYFSQWYQSKFTVDGIEYNCAEQYMMAMKADLFGDKEAYDKIMKAHDPSTQKATGRKVKNFNADLWNKVSRAFVYRANMAKFSTPYLKDFILGTGNAEIVEASPTDCIWGIGLPMGHSDLEDKTKWRGTNWLGEVLMQVRETLRGTK